MQYNPEGKIYVKATILVLFSSPAGDHVPLHSLSRSQQTFAPSELLPQNISVNDLLSFSLLLSAAFQNFQPGKRTK